MGPRNQVSPTVRLQALLLEPSLPLFSCCSYSWVCAYSGGGAGQMARMPLDLSLVTGAKLGLHQHITRGKSPIALLALGHRRLKVQPAMAIGVDISL